MRLRYLKEHRKELYTSLLLTEKLYPHLLEIDEAANERMDILMPQLMKAAGVTEELKAADQMKWVRLANNCKAQAAERYPSTSLCLALIKSCFCIIQARITVIFLQRRNPCFDCPGKNKLLLQNCHSVFRNVRYIFLRKKVFFQIGF